MLELARPTVIVSHTTVARSGFRMRSCSRSRVPTAAEWTEMDREPKSPGDRPLAERIGKRADTGDAGETVERGTGEAGTSSRAALPSPAKAPLKPGDGRLVRGRRSRARIREAARALFAERGFDGATLRAIAERAGMGASSIYRHVRSKEELLIDELVQLQEDAWLQFRKDDDRKRPTRERVARFLDAQHRLFVADPDFTMIALRATTKPEARVARQVLALNDRTIGLLMEILQMGRMSKDLDKRVDVLEAARVLFNITQGARIPWANGLVTPEVCFEAIRTGVDLLFQGIGAVSPSAARAPLPPTTPGP